MTTPSNSTFYQWGYHDPGKDPILPLSNEQREILERVITTTDGSVEIGYQLLPSGEALQDPSKYYNIAIDSDKSHISAPALYPHDPEGTGLRIDRGNHYFSSGNYTVWPSPNGQDRYSAYWWDVSGIYFSPDIYNETYYAYPTLPSGNGASIILFDDLDHDLYLASGIAANNTNKKYLLWLTGRNVDQMGMFHHGRQLNKIIKIPVTYSKRQGEYVYKEEERKYYYSHFSNADHDKVDKGFEDFRIFYTYIHYIPKLKNANQKTHEKVVNDLSNLNEIPFLSNAKSVYLYSVYGAGKFKDLQAQDWTSVNFWDSSYSPVGIASDFHNVLDSPAPPFPPRKRGEKESEDQEYNSEEELQQKFDAVSGLLGF